jgi:hypothetical protein
MIPSNCRKVVFVLTVLSLVGLYLAGAPAQKSPFPWKFGGYEKIDTLHLKYWSAAKDAFDDAQNFTKPGFPTEIDELWFSMSAQSFRVDKYVEKGAVKCNQFKGKAWEMITENGIEYVLNERIIQTGATRTLWYLENIASGGGKEICEYKRFDGPKPAVDSVRNALSILTMSPYLADPEYEEMAVSSLELDKVMDPAKYKVTLQELKKTYDTAGRKTAKFETGHGLYKFKANGYAYVDLEWGLGLEGYLIEVQKPNEQAIALSTPVCIYKVLSVETKIDDPKVFDKQ